MHYLCKPMKRKIELLSPARDAACGREAVLHGADAVYIGGPAFGARAQAGNDVESIAALCRFAHTYDARVYVTLNTILYDDELAEAERIAWALYRAGADALIVQDVGLLRLDLPPIALHASTQMDNRSPEEARFLESVGFSQIVVARELSLAETARIHAAVNVPLEAFVHGALCVSYSGRCYASEHCFARSANRGRCAQFCRLPFDLIDADGKCVVAGRHLLSLRDMNRTASLEEMMDAGISSFKIEGRLKDAAYVKNVTAWYRRELDKVLARRSAHYERASWGTTRTTFDPQPEKSFNRGFTEYFLHGRGEPIHCFETPKARGEAVGRVERVGRGSLSVTATTARFANGDGLCFLDREGRLHGFRLNRAEGRELFPAEMPEGLRPGTALYRNHDQAFEKVLAHLSAERKLGVSLTLRETAAGYAIDARDETGRSVSLAFDAPHETARTPQRENIGRQLTRLGDTPFECTVLEIATAGERFIPASQLAAWRRATTDALLRAHRCTYERPLRQAEDKSAALPATQLDYTANVANRAAAAFYADHGATRVQPAYELQPPAAACIMECRHCLRHALGCCTRDGKPLPWKEPLMLQTSDGKRFRLQFDCKNCQMNVYATH